MDKPAYSPREQADGHEHKFHSGRAHRHAHKLERLDAQRRRVRAQRRRVVRSEWLDRRPGSPYEVGRRQTGRTFGPAPRWNGSLGLSRGPMDLDKRTDAYRRQTGRKELTPAQARRARKKERSEFGTHVCDFREADGTTAGVCHLLGAHGGKAAA